MENYTTISKKPLEQPAMDFTFLRKEGIAHIQNLAGRFWSDHNIHDPGITILEYLCYAITDLAYRLSFDMNDLLAESPTTELNTHNEAENLSFTARNILTVNPLTIHDYRKLIIDIVGVKNAWLEKSNDPGVILGYVPETHVLTLSDSENLEPVPLNGLYNVYVEKEQFLADSQEAQLKEKIKAILHQQRNLGENFAEVRILPFEDINVKFKLIIEDGVDENTLLAQVYFNLSQFISPSLRRYSLAQMLEKGKPIEEIYNGPMLTTGFFDDEELEQFSRKTELYASDLIRVILDVEGAKAIKNITLSSSLSAAPQSWVLSLNSDYTPKLKGIDAFLKEDVQVERRQIACTIDPMQVQAKFTALYNQSTNEYDIEDVAIPLGDYRHVSEYTSIRHEFPLNYNVGNVGLPNSATEKQKAQVLQLKAYLMFFDQLLANYFAQLSHIKDFLCLHNIANLSLTKTYFTQTVEEDPELNKLLKHDLPHYRTAVSQLVENNEIKLERKNRLFNHLLAFFSERFTDYALMQYAALSRKHPSSQQAVLNETEKNNLSSLYMESKLNYLRAYPRLSAYRGKAFNYYDQSNLFNTDNISGLKERISKLLGLLEQGEALLTMQDFYIVEHILLRPSIKWPLGKFFGMDIAKPLGMAASSSIVGYTTFQAHKHGLKEGDKIKIFANTGYDGIYTVAHLTANSFDIEHAFAGEDYVYGHWITLERMQLRDPYSFQISFVFPKWPGQLADSDGFKNFQKLVEEIIITETPAHITCYLHWLDAFEMEEFKSAYEAWLLEAAKEPDPTDFTQQDVTNELTKILLDMSYIDTA